MKILTEKFSADVLSRGDELNEMRTRLKKLNSKMKVGSENNDEISI